MGTYPYGVWGSDGREAYESAWCVVMGLATASLGVVGLITGKSRLAAIFVGILLLCWTLTLFRFVFMNQQVYN
jgi:hypothetical protein